MAQYYCRKCFSVRVIPAYQMRQIDDDAGFRLVQIPCPQCGERAARFGPMAVAHAYELGREHAQQHHEPRSVSVIFDASQETVEWIRKSRKKEQD